MSPKTCVLLALLTSPVLAQNRQVPAVEIQAQAEDPVGSELAYSLREQVAASNLMRPSSGTESRYVIHLVTLDSDGNGRSTEYSYAISYASKNGDLYLGNSVGICGAARVAACATDVLAAMTNKVFP
jgi:hypothetical protein